MAEWLRRSPATLYATKCDEFTFVQFTPIDSTNATTNVVLSVHEALYNSRLVNVLCTREFEPRRHRLTDDFFDF